jgi:hypothetical protein
MGARVNPQKVSKGCKKYIEIKIRVFSFISSLNIFFAIKPIKIKK